MHSNALAAATARMIHTSRYVILSYLVISSGCSLAARANELGERAQRLRVPAYRVITRHAAASPRVVPLFLLNPKRAGSRLLDRIIFGIAGRLHVNRADQPRVFKSSTFQLSTANSVQLVCRSTWLYSEIDCDFDFRDRRKIREARSSVSPSISSRCCRDRSRLELKCTH